MGTRQTNQRKYLSYSIDLFQGGVDSDASPYMLPPGLASVGENIEFYRDNTIRARRGLHKVSAQAKQGMFLTHRLSGEVKQVYRNGTNLHTLSNTTATSVGTVPASDHQLQRIVGGMLIVQPEGVRLLDLDGLNLAAVPKPEPLTATVAQTGKLIEGRYEYTYAYLLRGGDESLPSEVLNVTVPSVDGRVTVTFPTPPTHPKLFRKLLFRKGPKDGIPLQIAELDVNATTFVDDGVKASAKTPVQGIRAMPGGNLALVHNRRLLVVDADTLHYSYPGSYAYSNVFWTEKLNLPTGESIRAMCPLGQGVIFFGLETALYMNGTPAEGGAFAPISVPDGCVSQQAWTSAEDGTLFYVGKGGVYAMQGVQAQRISDPVSDQFRNLGISELTKSTLVYDQQERRLLVTLPTVVLVFSFVTRAWAVWTLPGLELDNFEGRLHIYGNGSFGVLGESPNDDGEPIHGKFVSGVSGLDDPVVHKVFRRMGVQVSAAPTDDVSLSVRSLDYEAAYSGLPDRENTGSTWGVAIWGVNSWSGNTDTTQTVSFPDRIQGRYLQFTITFDTLDANRFVLMGPVVVEYRPSYRYGRG